MTARRTAERHFQAVRARPSPTRIAGPTGSRPAATVRSAAEDAVAAPQQVIRIEPLLRGDEGVPEPPEVDPPLLEAEREGTDGVHRAPHRAAAFIDAVVL